MNQTLFFEKWGPKRTDHWEVFTKDLDALIESRTTEKSDLFNAAGMIAAALVNDPQYSSDVSAETAAHAVLLAKQIREEIQLDDEEKPHEDDNLAAG